MHDPFDHLLQEEKIAEEKSYNEKMFAIMMENSRKEEEKERKREEEKLKRRMEGAMVLRQQIAVRIS